MGFGFGIDCSGEPRVDLEMGPRVYHGFLEGHLRILLDEGDGLSVEDFGIEEGDILFYNSNFGTPSGAASAGHVT
jgi:hypothetical protein